MKEADKPEVIRSKEQPLEVTGPHRLEAVDGEPPVVARLIVEIRSDGTRTIARGAIEDVASGQKTAIEARGSSPLQLALALARSLGQLPRLAARSTMARAGLRRLTIGRLLGRKK